MPLPMAGLLVNVDVDVDDVRRQRQRPLVEAEAQAQTQSEAHCYRTISKWSATLATFAYPSQWYSWSSSCDCAEANEKTATNNRRQRSGGRRTNACLVCRSAACEEHRQSQSQSHLHAEAEDEAAAETAAKLVVGAELEATGCRLLLAGWVQKTGALSSLSSCLWPRPNDDAVRMRLPPAAATMPMIVGHW